MHALHLKPQGDGLSITPTKLPLPLTTVGLPLGTLCAHAWPLLSSAVKQGVLGPLQRQSAMIGVPDPEVGSAAYISNDVGIRRLKPLPKLQIEADTLLEKRGFARLGGRDEAGCFEEYDATGGGTSIPLSHPPIVSVGDSTNSSCQGVSNCNFSQLQKAILDTAQSYQEQEEALYGGRISMGKLRASILEEILTSQKEEIVRFLASRKEEQAISWSSNQNNSQKNKAVSGKQRGRLRRGSNKQSLSASDEIDTCKSLLARGDGLVIGLSSDLKRNKDIIWRHFHKLFLESSINSSSTSAAYPIKSLSVCELSPLKTTTQYPPYQPVSYPSNKTDIVYLMKKQIDFLMYETSKVDVPHGTSNNVIYPAKKITSGSYHQPQLMVGKEVHHHTIFAVATHLAALACCDVEGASSCFVYLVSKICKELQLTGAGVGGSPTGGATVGDQVTIAIPKSQQQHQSFLLTSNREFLSRVLLPLLHLIPMAKLPQSLYHEMGNSLFTLQTIVEEAMIHLTPNPVNMQTDQIVSFKERFTVKRTPPTVSELNRERDDSSNREGGPAVNTATNLMANEPPRTASTAGFITSACTAVTPLCYAHTTTVEVIGMVNSVVTVSHVPLDITKQTTTVRLVAKVSEADGQEDREEDSLIDNADSSCDRAWNRAIFHSPGTLLYRIEDDGIPGSMVSLAVTADIRLSVNASLREEMSTAIFDALSFVAKYLLTESLMGSSKYSHVSQQLNNNHNNNTFNLNRNLNIIHGDETPSNSSNNSLFQPEWVLPLCQAGFIHPSKTITGRQNQLTSNTSDSGSSHSSFCDSTVSPSYSEFPGSGGRISVGEMVLKLNDNTFALTFSSRKRDISWKRAVVAIAAHHLFGFMELSSLQQNHQNHLSMGDDDIDAVIEADIFEGVIKQLIRNDSAFRQIIRIISADDGERGNVPFLLQCAGESDSAEAKEAMYSFNATKLAEFMCTNIYPLCSYGPYSEDVVDSLSSLPSSSLFVSRGIITPAVLAEKCLYIVHKKVTAKQITEVVMERSHLGSNHLTGLKLLRKALFCKAVEASHYSKLISSLRSYLTRHPNPPAARISLSYSVDINQQQQQFHYIDTVRGCGYETEQKIREEFHAVISRLFVIVRVLKGEANRASPDTCVCLKVLPLEGRPQVIFEGSATDGSSCGDLSFAFTGDCTTQGTQLITASALSPPAHRYVRNEMPHGNVILGILTLLACPLDAADMVHLKNPQRGGLGRSIIAELADLLPQFSVDSLSQRSPSFSVTESEDGGFAAEQAAQTTLEEFLDLWNGSSGKTVIGDDQNDMIMQKRQNVSSSGGVSINLHRDLHAGGFVTDFSVSPFFVSRLPLFTSQSKKAMHHAEISIITKGRSRNRPQELAPSITVALLPLREFIIPYLDGKSISGIQSSLRGKVFYVNTGNGAYSIPEPEQKEEEDGKSSSILPCVEMNDPLLRLYTGDTLGVSIVTESEGSRAGERTVQYAVNGQLVRSLPLIIPRRKAVGSTAVVGQSDGPIYHQSLYLAIFAENAVPDGVSLKANVRFSHRDFKYEPSRRHPCAHDRPTHHLVSVLASLTFHTVIERVAEFGASAADDLRLEMESISEEGGIRTPQSPNLPTRTRRFICNNQDSSSSFPTPLKPSTALTQFEAFIHLLRLGEEIVTKKINQLKSYSNDLQQAMAVGNRQGFGLAMDDEILSPSSSFSTAATARVKFNIAWSIYESSMYSLLCSGRVLLGGLVVMLHALRGRDEGEIDSVGLVNMGYPSIQCDEDGVHRSHFPRYYDSHQGVCEDHSAIRSPVGSANTLMIKPHIPVDFLRSVMDTVLNADDNDHNDNGILNQTQPSSRLHRREINKKASISISAAMHVLQAAVEYGVIVHSRDISSPNNQSNNETVYGGNISTTTLSNADISSSDNILMKVVQPAKLIISESEMMRLWSKLVALYNRSSIDAEYLVEEKDKCIYRGLRFEKNSYMTTSSSYRGRSLPQFSFPSIVNDGYKIINGLRDDDCAIFGSQSSLITLPNYPYSSVPPGAPQPSVTNAADDGVFISFSVMFSRPRNPGDSVDICSPGTAIGLCFEGWRSKINKLIHRYARDTTATGWSKEFTVLRAKGVDAGHCFLLPASASAFPDFRFVSETSYRSSSGGIGVGKHSDTNKDNNRLSPYFQPHEARRYMGNWLCPSNGAIYGDTDIITVIVDRKNRTIAFERNSNPLGTLYALRRGSYRCGVTCVAAGLGMTCDDDDDDSSFAASDGFSALFDIITPTASDESLNLKKEEIISKKTVAGAPALNHISHTLRPVITTGGEDHYGVSIVRPIFIKRIPHQCTSLARSLLLSVCCPLPLIERVIEGQKVSRTANTESGNDILTTIDNRDDDRSAEYHGRRERNMPLLLSVFGGNGDPFSVRTSLIHEEKNKVVSIGVRRGLLDSSNSHSSHLSAGTFIRNLGGGDLLMQATLLAAIRGQRADVLRSLASSEGDAVREDQNMEVFEYNDNEGDPVIDDDDWEGNDMGDNDDDEEEDGNHTPDRPSTPGTIAGDTNPTPSPVRALSVLRTISVGEDTSSASSAPPPGIAPGHPLMALLGYASSSGDMVVHDPEDPVQRHSTQLMRLHARSRPPQLASEDRDDYGEPYHIVRNAVWREGTITQFFDGLKWDTRARSTIFENQYSGYRDERSDSLSSSSYVQVRLSQGTTTFSNERKKLNQIRGGERSTTVVPYTESAYNILAIRSSNSKEVNTRGDDVPHVLHLPLRNVIVSPSIQETWLRHYYSSNLKFRSLSTNCNSQEGSDSCTTVHGGPLLPPIGLTAILIKHLVQRLLYGCISHMGNSTNGNSDLCPATTACPASETVSPLNTNINISSNSSSKRGPRHCIMSNIGTVVRTLKVLSDLIGLYSSLPIPNPWELDQRGKRRRSSDHSHKLISQSHFEVEGASNSSCDDITTSTPLFNMSELFFLCSTEEKNKLLQIILLGLSIRIPSGTSHSRNMAITRVWDSIEAVQRNLVIEIPLRAASLSFLSSIKWTIPPVAVESINTPASDHLDDVHVNSISTTGIVVAPPPKPNTRKSNCNVPTSVNDGEGVVAASTVTNVHRPTDDVMSSSITLPPSHQLIALNRSWDGEVTPLSKQLCPMCLCSPWKNQVECNWKNTSPHPSGSEVNTAAECQVPVCHHPLPSTHCEKLSWIIAALLKGNKGEKHGDDNGNNDCSGYLNLLPNYCAYAGISGTIWSRSEEKDDNVDGDVNNNDDTAVEFRGDSNNIRSLQIVEVSEYTLMNDYGFRGDDEGENNYQRSDGDTASTYYSSISKKVESNTFNDTNEVSFYTAKVRGNGSDIRGSFLFDGYLTGAGCIMDLTLTYLFTAPSNEIQEDESGSGQGNQDEAVGEGWECQACTYLNEGASLRSARCEMCQTVRQDVPTCHCSGCGVLMIASDAICSICITPNRSAQRHARGEASASGSDKESVSFEAICMGECGKKRQFDNFKTFTSRSPCSECGLDTEWQPLTTEPFTANMKCTLGVRGDILYCQWKISSIPAKRLSPTGTNPVMIVRSGVRQYDSSSSSHTVETSTLLAQGYSLEGLLKELGTLSRDSTRIKTAQSIADRPLVPPEAAETLAPFNHDIQQITFSPHHPLPPLSNEPEGYFEDIAIVVRCFAGRLFEAVLEVMTAEVLGGTKRIHGTDSHHHFCEVVGPIGKSGKSSSAEGSLIALLTGLGRATLWTPSEVISNNEPINCGLLRGITAVLASHQNRKSITGSSKNPRRICAEFLFALSNQFIDMFEDHSSQKHTVDFLYPIAIYLLSLQVQTNYITIAPKTERHGATPSIILSPTTADHCPSASKDDTDNGVNLFDLLNYYTYIFGCYVVKRSTSTISSRRALLGVLDKGFANALQSIRGVRETTNGRSFKYFFNIVRKSYLIKPVTFIHFPTKWDDIRRRDESRYRNCLKIYLATTQGVLQTNADSIPFECITTTLRAVMSMTICSSPETIYYHHTDNNLRECDLPQEKYPPTAIGGVSQHLPDLFNLANNNNVASSNLLPPIFWLVKLDNTTNMTSDGSLEFGQVRGSVPFDSQNKGKWYYEVVFPSKGGPTPNTTCIGWCTKPHFSAGARSHVGSDLYSLGLALRSVTDRHRYGGLIDGSNLLVMGGDEPYNIGCMVGEGDVIGCLVDMEDSTMCWSINGRLLESRVFVLEGEIYPCVSANSSDGLLIRLGGTCYLPEGYSDFTTHILGTRHSFVCSDSRSESTISTVLHPPPKDYNFYLNLSQWLNSLAYIGVTPEAILALAISNNDENDSVGGIDSKATNSKALLDSIIGHLDGVPIVKSFFLSVTAGNCYGQEKDNLSNNDETRKRALRMLAPYIHHLMVLSRLSQFTYGIEDDLRPVMPSFRRQFDRVRRLMLLEGRETVLNHSLSMHLMHGSNSLKVSLRPDDANATYSTTSEALRKTIVGQLYDATCVKEADFYKKIGPLTVQLVTEGQTAVDQGGVLRTMISIFSEEVMYSINEETNVKVEPKLPLFTLNGHSTRFSVVPNVSIINSSISISAVRDRALEMFKWIGKMFGHAVMSGDMFFSVTFPRLVWKKLLDNGTEECTPTLEDYFFDCDDQVQGVFWNTALLLDDDVFFTIPNIQRHYDPATMKIPSIMLRYAKEVALHQESCNNPNGDDDDDDENGGVGSFPKHHSIYSIISPTVQTNQSSAADGGFPSEDPSAIQLIQEKYIRKMESLKTHRRDAAERALLSRYDPALKLIKEGLWEVLPASAKEEMTWEDMKRRITGIVEFDSVDLLAGMDLSRVPDSIKQQFIDAVSRLDTENLRQLLLFCTGQLSMPPPEKIQVRLGDNPSALPTSHTCSPISLTINDYGSVEEMINKIKIVNRQSHNFGVA